MPGKTQSNQTSELYAALQVAKTTPKETPLLIRSDSEYVINGLTKNLTHWEDKGWIGVSNSEMFKATAAWLRSRSSTTSLQWVKGHNGETGNKGADRLAGEGALLPQAENLNLDAPANFVHTGAKLATMTQASLYMGILEQKKSQERMGTIVSLDLARWAIKDLSNKLPIDSAIWKSIRNKDITRKIREFLWKSMHNAHKCGKFWNNIPGLEQRATCPVCNEEESMEHILLECNAPGQKIIWKLTKELWLKKHDTWPVPKYGTIQGCSMADFKTEEGAPQQGKNRLYRILMSESAFLIWKLRCERRISKEDDPEKFHSETEIHNRWVATINNRLNLDKLMTNHKKYGKKALKERAVIQTWTKTLYDENNLLDNWLQQSGVLVGIRARRPPGRNR